MINYDDRHFGVHTLLRAYGSAAYRAIVIACASSGIYLILYRHGDWIGVDELEDELLEHPYPIAVICTAFLFVISSKVTFSYNRYWEACTALHNMHAKWLDVGSTMASFHLQSDAYDAIRPPSYGDRRDGGMHVEDLVIRRDWTDDTDVTNPPEGQPQVGRVFGGDGEERAPSNLLSQARKKLGLNGRLARINNKRGRGEANIKKGDTVSIQCTSLAPPLPFPDYSNRLQSMPRKGLPTLSLPRRSRGGVPLGGVTSPTSCRSAGTDCTDRTFRRATCSDRSIEQKKGDAGTNPATAPSSAAEQVAGLVSLPRPLPSRDPPNGAPAATGRSFAVGEDNRPMTVAPSPFLKEAAHLVSLLSAVSLSTLRCDAEGADAPLAEFVPGCRWPSCDSDNDRDMRRRGYQRRRPMMTLRYLLGLSRPRSEREGCNAARPFPVVGGVSDREATLLRSARGSSAKTALVFMWLQEFMVREHICGSLGAVAPPVFSRLPHYLSDGHMWYNAARKASYVPLPFPHAQMAAACTVVCMVVVPALMLSKTTLWFGLVLNFVAVTIFQGLAELSRELENPFRGMPNDLPLNLFQAHFNEALVTMFAGFHPDAWRQMK